MNAIVIMAKAPLPTEVKTRLTPPLDPEMASRLYQSFLLDKIEQVRGIEEVHPFVAYTPGKEADFFKNIVPRGFILISQVGDELGERLANISKSLFRQGFEKLLILDSDTPNLPPQYIQEAFARLDETDVVIGPCDDGGYYLIGMKTHIPELFKGIPWSTSEVTEITVKKAAALGATISKLATWYDVDTLDDLIRLKGDLTSLSKDKKESFFCENTCRVISGMNIEQYFEKT